MKIDLSYLREMSGGNKELVLEMISIFKTQVVEFANNMDLFLKDKQYEQLGKLAHKAKSSVSIMGLEEQALQLKNLEQFTQQGIHIDSYPKMVDSFKKDTSEAVKELDMVVQNLELYF